MQSSPGESESTVSILLAAGEGKRMRSSDRPKVCFPVQGCPAIARTIATLDSCGIRTHLLVVGRHAEQVMSAARTAPGSQLFCLQPVPRGTGDATRIAAEALRSLGHSGAVLVAAGDKVIQPAAIRRLIGRFRSSACDMALLTDDLRSHPSAGRIVLDSSGRPARIVEAAEAAGDPEAEQTARANLAVYLFRSDALYGALARLTPEPDKEEYFTDVVAILREMGASIEMVPVSDSTEVMAFNTPEELAEVHARLDTFAAVVEDESPSAARSLEFWSRWLDSEQGSRELRSLYGGDASLVQGRRMLLQRMLAAYAERFGPGEVAIARAPGRINVMGRHVDHQGGHCNMMALPRDTWVVAGPRSDGIVEMAHLDSIQFSADAFRLADLAVGAPSQSWRGYVDSAAVRLQASRDAASWTQYVRAVFARLAWDGLLRRTTGVNLLAAGDVPMAAGLSSSSTLVVAVMEAVCALGYGEWTDPDFIRLCGEAEWFVGTRGGSGDHAAMKMSRSGKVVQIGFEPLTLAQVTEFPEGSVLVVFDSGVQAKKNLEARARFNHRVACYLAGAELLRIRYPAHAPAIRHLRDVNARALGVQEAEILRMVGALPERMTRAEVEEALRGRPLWERLGGMLETDDPLPIRAVVLYGLAECERSRACPELLRAGGGAALGRLMNISHDGDRVVSWIDGRPQAYHRDFSDAAMEALIQQPEPLLEEPGAYGCSTPEIDAMVDIARSVPGILGAQLSGAGLGGCIMVLAREEAVERLEAEMERRYYTPRAMDSRALRAAPATGSGALRP